MFENIGGKIKGLAKFCAYACVICGVIVVLIGLANYIPNADRLRLATVTGIVYSNTLPSYEAEKAYMGFLLLKYGLIAAVAGFICSWPLYGFGELIENTAVIARLMTKNDREKDNK